MEGALRGQHAWSHLLTIHLQDVGLEQLLMAQGMAGVVAHVDCGHLGDIQGIILTKVLWGKRTKMRSLLCTAGGLALQEKHLPPWHLLLCIWP